MGRKLYYIDSYGKVHRDKKAEKAQVPSAGMSATRIILWVLVAMAVLVVLSSVR